MPDEATDFAVVFKRDDIEMFKYRPNAVTGQIAREFRARYGQSTRALWDEFANPEYRDVDTFIKVVWLADRMGANTMTPDAVEAMLGTQGNIFNHWSFEVVEANVPEEITADIDPQS